MRYVWNTSADPSESVISSLCGTFSTPKSAEVAKAVSYVCVVAVGINSIIKTNTKVLYERKGCSVSFGRNLVLAVLWVTGQLRGLAAQARSPDIRDTEVQQVHKSLLLPSLKFLAGTCLLSSGLFSTGHLPGEQRFAWFPPSFAPTVSLSISELF